MSAAGVALKMSQIQNYVGRISRNDLGVQRYDFWVMQSLFVFCSLFTLMEDLVYSDGSKLLSFIRLEREHCAGANKEKVPRQGGTRASRTGKLYIVGHREAHSWENEVYAAIMVWISDVLLSLLPSLWEFCTGDSVVCVFVNKERPACQPASEMSITSQSLSTFISSVEGFASLGQPPFKWVFNGGKVLNNLAVVQGQAQKAAQLSNVTRNRPLSDCGYLH